MDRRDTSIGRETMVLHLYIVKWRPVKPIDGFAGYELLRTAVAARVSTRDAPLRDCIASLRRAVAQADQCDESDVSIYSWEMGLPIWVDPDDLKEA